MTHICQKERRERKGKEKKSEKEKEKEKKAERSTVKMYYWNVALSEHCEEVPLECGSVHWNTEEVCEVAPFTQCQARLGPSFTTRSTTCDSSRAIPCKAATWFHHTTAVSWTILHSELLGPVSQQSASQQRQPFLSRHRA